MLAPMLFGLLLAGGFVLGGLVVREIRRSRTRQVRAGVRRRGLAARCCWSSRSVNGIAEELFFRGAAYAAIPRHPVVWTTLAYVVATLATGNVMLAFAAILLGRCVACSGARAAACSRRS